MKIWPYSLRPIAALPPGKRRWFFLHLHLGEKYCQVEPGLHWSYGYRDGRSLVLKVDMLPKNINGIVIGVRRVGALWLYFRRRPTL